MSQYELWVLQVTSLLVSELNTSEVPTRPVKLSPSFKDKVSAALQPGWLATGGSTG